MASVKVLKTLTIGKGITMEISVDEAHPEDSIDRYAITVHCTGEEAFIVPSHWHKQHQEHMTVLEGRIEMTLDGKKSIINGGDPEVLVPRRAVHSFTGFKGEKLVIRERPDPAGLYKALFFNDLFSAEGWSGMWHTMRVFYDGDSYPALPVGSRLVDQAFVTVLGGIAKLFVGKKPETL